VPRRSGGIFDYDNKKERLEEVLAELEDPNVWNDQERAQKLGRERVALQNIVDVIDGLDNGLDDAKDLLEMGREEDDQETVDSVATDLESFEKKVAELEFHRMFAGEQDGSDAFIDIQSGSGGTEAQDWADMLLRMYLRWGERRLPRFDLKVTMPTGGSEPKPVSTGWCVKARLIPAIVATHRLLRCLSRPKWMMILISRSTPRISELMFIVPVAQAGST